ncbi:MAG: 50S ribosomal protein L18 [Candidatus Omnitrophota bacterium]
MDREQKRAIRHQRVRRRVIGTTQRPRLSIHRSLKHFYAQLVDDIAQKTLFSCSTLGKPFREGAKGKKGVELTSELGRIFATEVKSKGCSEVVFDRGGYPYHGQVKAFAEACRKHGLVF